MLPMGSSTTMLRNSMGHISTPPGKRPHLAQLSREVLWLSLSVSLSLCCCGSHQHESQIPASPRGISSQLKLLLLSGHSQELQEPISPHPPVQDITATLWPPIRAQGQAQQDSDGTKPIKSRLRARPIPAWTGCH